MAKLEPAKINRKAALRFGIGLGILVILLGAYAYFTLWSKDPVGASTFSSSGYIAAVEESSNGSQVVMFDPAGAKVASPAFVEGSSDRAPTWKGDGNQLFFLSDRENRETHIYRWAPGANDLARRSLDSRGKNTLSFVVPGGTEPSKTAILTTGGAVLEYNPEDSSLSAILPPSTKTTAVANTEEGGNVGVFSAMYGRFGESFKKALWGYQKQWVYAVLRKEDGEVLIMQKTGPGTTPQLLAAADRIDFDVNPVTGALVYCIIGLQPPSNDPKNWPPEMLDQYMKNKKIVMPFMHRIEMIDPVSGARTLIAESKDNKIAFYNPVVSPDGGSMAVEVRIDNTTDPKKRILSVVPLEDAGGTRAANLLRAGIDGVTWHPSGKSLAFVAPDEKGDRAIWTINTDGSGKKQLTTAGSFSAPAFSPQN